MNQAIITTSSSRTVHTIGTVTRYFRFYTHYLYQHGPTSHPTDQVPTVEQEVFYEGTVENIQIGAMADIIKQ